MQNAVFWGHVQNQYFDSRDNRTLIRSGEARLVGWSRQVLYSGLNTLPRSVVRSANSIDRSDNLDVIRLRTNRYFNYLTSVPLELKDIHK